jgi:hypothetical protein
MSWVILVYFLTNVHEQLLGSSGTNNHLEQSAFGLSEWKQEM